MAVAVCRSATVVPVGGDILTAIDGSKVNAMEDMVKYLETKAKVGQVVNLTITRDSTEQTVQATLGEQPRS